MKHLDKMIKCCALLVAMACVNVSYAVTLPTTSYNPSYQTLGDEPSYSGMTLNSPSFSSSKFSMFGSSWGDECGAGTAPLDVCTTCCANKLAEVCPDPSQCDPEYVDMYTSCANDCGRSLPLGSGLSMIIMALCYGGVRAVISNRKKSI